MPNLIPAPILDSRNEEQLAAEMIARVSGGLSANLLKSKIAVLQEELALVEAGGLASPVCTELTNADPAASHTVILETIGIQLGEFARRINYLPLKNQIEFINLLGIEVRVATKAAVALEFSVFAPPGQSVTIPAGTQISTEDGAYIFETTVERVIPADTATANDVAVRTVTGHTLLSPDVVTRLIDNIPFVLSVTNPGAVDSGTEDETIESALQRARRYLRRGERWVSAKDIEEGILDEALLGNGLVRAFPFVVNGDFTTHVPGHISIIVSTRTGDPISAEDKERAYVLLAQLIGNQWPYLIDPVTVDFNIEANVRLDTAAPQGATLAAIERNLRAFYAADKKNFGRPIALSEIIGIIENTSGVDRIIYELPGPILASPLVDMKLDYYKVPKLVEVTLNVV